METWLLSRPAVLRDAARIVMPVTLALFVPGAVLCFATVWVNADSTMSILQLTQCIKDALLFGAIVGPLVASTFLAGMFPLFRPLLKRVAERWESRFGSEPPRPLGSLLGRMNVLRRFFLNNLLTQLLAVYYVMVPVALVVAMGSLLPITLAERVRSRLVPDVPIASDLIAWTISAVLAGYVVMR